ncbi:MAG: nucleotide exchange factor GrpE [Candidatus Altarchaeum sp.]|nr:nucleotide exchange factor GrpE [Candidatus Altarchaeum sp.]
MKITYDGLMRAFNIEAISPAHGQYKYIDEIKHTAIDTINNSNYPENTIVYTVRNGYCFDDEIIRPAEVVVFVGGKQVKKSEETHKEIQEIPKKKGLFDKFFSPILNIAFKFIFKNKTRYLDEKTEEILLKEQKIATKENSLTN